MSKFTILPLSVFLCCLFLFLCTETTSLSPLLKKKDQRTTIVETEFGDISTVVIGDECGGPYHIHFITLEPNALLIPVILLSDVVFFVHTGNGIMNWIDEDKERTLELKPGDIYRLRSGTVFYLQSNLETTKLRVYAIFDKECVHEPCLGAYSSINDLLLGFDERILRSAFAVPEEVLWTVRNSKKPKLITNVQLRNGSRWPGDQDGDKTWQSRLVGLFVGDEDVTDHLGMKPVFNGDNKESSAYNVFEAKADFENNYGLSKTVVKKDLDVLKGSSFGVFLVNLTQGSMVGQHWNPRACEISIVLHGPGMVRVVTPATKSKNKKLMVEEEDVFVVPKFHPMAQMSFENRSFVFTGFSTSVKENYPQFLVGQSSVLEVLDEEILEIAFNVKNETMESLLRSQKESVMLGCVGCAEKELDNLRREIEEDKRRKEEEERKREKERKRREEEAEGAREREEERKREEERAKRQEEERKRREKEAEEAREREEEQRREEEKARRQEEERKRREREAEEARKREEERRRRREEEKARRQEEERKRREKEAEEAREREEERRREEEIAKKQEEERKRREREAEEAREREEQRKKEEEEAKRREEERQRKEREEERRKREKQETERREEEARKREEEEARREEEERKRREEEEKWRSPPQPQPQPQLPPEL